MHFFDCMNMTGTLDLGASVESIEYRAFQDCAFSGDLVLPESVRYVGEKAFRQFSDRGMFRGGQLVLNEGLEEIGEGAFKSVKFTGTLVIPSTVTKIGGFEKERFNEGNGSYSLGAFEDTAFTELVFTENSQLESLGDATFMGTYIRGGRVEVPATVREIGHMCFSGTGPYEYFSLASASNLEYIGECAFRNVDFGAGSPTIKWPDNMTTVRYEAFESAENISVDLHDGITEIEAYAFRWFSGKVTTEGELRLPAGLIGIGNWNWAVIPDRDEVSYLKLPGNLEVIGASTYIDTNNVYIPASVRIIRDNGFGSNTSEDAIYQTLYFGMDESVSDSWSDQWNKGFSDSHQTMFWNVPEADFDAIMNNDSVPYDVAEPVVGYDSETVTLSCDTSFAHIYYTLDGSEPDKDSTLYTEPFRHIGDFTLKAVAYVGNGIYSDVVTKPLSSVGAGGID